MIVQYIIQDSETDTSKFVHLINRLESILECEIEIEISQIAFIRNELLFGKLYNQDFVSCYEAFGRVVHKTKNCSYVQRALYKYPTKNHDITVHKKFLVSSIDIQNIDRVSNYFGCKEERDRCIKIIEKSDSGFIVIDDGKFQIGDDLAKITKRISEFS